MPRKKLLYVLMLVISLITLSINTAFAQGEPEGPPPPAFTGTVFALSFAFVLGLGGIVLYGTSKGDAEQKKTKAAKGNSVKSNKDVSVPNKHIKTNQDKKKLRKQFLAGEIDEKTYLEEVNKSK